MSTIQQWSFSRWKNYDTCPAKAKYLYVDKLKEPDGPAAERGRLIHKMAEDYTNGVIKRLPVELGAFPEEFKWLRKKKAECEKEWAFTRTWEPTDWFGADTWLRVKTDALVVTGTSAVVIDHKTGKVYPEHKYQMSLYALATFIMQPTVDTVEARLLYLDKGTTDKEDYERSEIPLIIEAWEARIRALLVDDTFAPRPSYACKWCHFRKENGGPCQF